MGVDTVNDLLAIVARCLPRPIQAFARATTLWVGLYGYAALRPVPAAFPWPAPTECPAREIHVLVSESRP